MNVSIINGLYFEKPCLRVIARITPNKKNGISRTYQKTWRIVCDNAEKSVEEIKAGAMAEANRWEQKIIRLERANAVLDNNAATHASADATEPALILSIAPPADSLP